MIFTWRQNFDRLIITLDGKILEYLDTYKYLGVILESMLNWKQHTKEQVKIAKASLMVRRRMLGKKWGLSPKIHSLGVLY